MLDPDVTTRDGSDDPIQIELRRAICVPTERYLWVPADMITFVPGLLDTIYGDGRALFGLATIHSRPAFYVIRGDSSWQTGSESGFPDGAPDFIDFIDRIYQDLEEQFGCAELDSEEDDPDLLAEESYPWPAFDCRDGSSWWRMSWPKLLGARFGKHPSTWRGNLLNREDAAEDVFARWADDGGPAIAACRHF